MTSDTTPIQALEVKFGNEMLDNLVIDTVLANMPIAYDIDKVVEELKDMSGIEWHCPDCSYAERDKNFIYLPEAIEIVKAGGKNE